MRILVTGSNGFLGSRLVQLARTRGHEVVGLGRSRTPTTEVDTYVRHDLRSPLPRGARAPGGADGVEAVVHCAALASPWAPARDFAAHNVDATAHVVRWSRDHGRPHLVHVSSSSVLYRRSHQYDLTPLTPVVPDAAQLNGYARSKAVSERVVARYDGTWAVLRPRAVFGPGDTTVLPRLLAVARKGVLPVPVAPGAPDGAVHCDLTYVDTAAEYLLRAAERRTTGTHNVTNGEPVALHPFLLDVFGRLGVHPRPVHVPVAAAEALARSLETAAVVRGGRHEPVLTRFGVVVLAYSKTFDPTALHQALGPAAVPLAEAVRRTVAAGVAAPAGARP